MGSRGPQSLPANVHLLRGNPSKKPFADLLGELRPEVALPDFPRWLWPEAKKEWKRLGEQLVKYGLVSKLDRAALTQYVQAWAKWAWAEQRLQAAIKAADQGRQAAEEKGESWNGGDGVMVPTANGNFQYSHYWVMSQRASAELDRHETKFGLHAAARSRVTPSDNRQGDMFEGETGQAGEDAWSKL